MIVFTTARGAKIEVTEDKYGIHAVVNGEMTLSSIKLADNATHGLSIETTLGQSITIPVPAEVATEVSALFDARSAAVRSMIDADKAYDAHTARVKRGMGS